MRSEYRQLILGEDFADLLAESAPAAAAAESVDRDALCGKLIANMRAQLALYVAYREQADRQRLALVNRRLTENQGVNGEVDKLLNSLGTLEAERIALADSILGARKAGDASTPAAPVKCEAIYPLVSAANAAALRETRGELLDTVAELKHVLAINQALVENGSKIIHTTIGILTSVVGRTKAEKMNTYTAKGGVNVGKVQIRNLVNRSV